MAVIGAAAVAAASAITQALIPKNVVTDTATQGDSSSSSEQDVSVIAQQENLSNSTTSTQSTSDTKTTNSADPDVIANLKSLAAQAMSNANDPTKTQGLISGILQSAGDAMTSIFGAQKAAGGYAGGTSQVLTNDTNARATADAASAVLGYQTNEQTLASDALGKLLTATSTTDVLNNTNSTSQTAADSIQNASTTTHSTSVANQDTATTTSSTSKSSSSIVCTWMTKNGYLDRRDYLESMRQFQLKGEYTKRGYKLFAAPLVAELERDRNSWKSQAIRWVFSNRTNWVCGRRNWKGAIGVLVAILGTAAYGIPLMISDFLDSGCYSE
jgi:hypothetical protein